MKQFNRPPRKKAKTVKLIEDKDFEVNLYEEVSEEEDTSVDLEGQEENQKELDELYEGSSE